MDYLKRNVEELMLQVGVMVAGVLAVSSWCISSSKNAMLSTYIVSLLPVLLVLVPDWNYFMRAPSEWADVVFVEPQLATKQIRRLALGRDIDLSADGCSEPQVSNSEPFMGSAMS